MIVLSTTIKSAAGIPDNGTEKDHKQANGLPGVNIAKLSPGQDSLKALL